MSSYIPLTPPDIYPASPADILTYMSNTQQTASGGELSDFNPSSPAQALNEGVLWAILEMLAYAQQIPLAAAIYHLQTLGVMQEQGANATVTLTVQLTAVQAYWELSAGYVVSTSNGLNFVTNTTLYIYDSDVGTVTATADTVGSAYNLPVFTINVIAESRAFLQSITNYEASEGGLDPESTIDVMARGYASARSHNVLITEDDFVQYAQSILGDNSIVEVVGRLGADKVSYVAGAIHIFALNADGSTLNAAQISSLQQQLQAQSPAFLQSSNIPSLATGIFVDSIELYQVEFQLVGSLIAGDDPETRATQIYNDLSAYLFPGQLALGETVVLYNLIAVAINAGLKDVQSLRGFYYVVNSLGESAEIFDSNIPLPNAWTALQMTEITIQLVDSSSNVSTYTYGTGGGSTD